MSLSDVALRVQSVAWERTRACNVLVGHRLHTSAMSSIVPNAFAFSFLCEGSWACKRFDRVACWVLTVINGYVAIRATHPAAAPDTASTTAGGAIMQGPETM